MLLLHRHDLDHHDLVFHLVHDLVLLQPMVHLDDNFQQLMEYRYRYEVGIAMVHLMHLQGVVMVGAQQIPDVLILDEVLTFQDVVLRYLVIPVMIVGAEMDVELRHLLKMDYFQDVVGAEPRHQLNQLQKRDYFQDAVQGLHFLPQVHFLPVGEVLLQRLRLLRVGL
jgi:hypothetical protein